jgi:Protein kinase domain
MMSEEPKFIQYLKQGRIDRPDEQVLATIAKRYSPQLQAALQIGRTATCVDLYQTVKELPSSFTRGVIQNDLKISINGPVSLAQPNILIAVDLSVGRHILIKLLRIPQTTTSQSYLAKKNATDAEINACRMVTEANIPGLVQSDVIEVIVKRPEGLDVAPGAWRALKMKRYVSSLTEIPQLDERWLYSGFSRTRKALKAMHKLNLVHSDVKSDNVFVTEDLDWDLGDFGSTRGIGSAVWSNTEVLTPYVVQRGTTLIPEMDFVLLCVTIAVEMKKDEWKDLCGGQMNVQEDLIAKRLNSIKDVVFKRELVELFERSMKTVREHLRYC